MKNEEVNIQQDFLITRFNQFAKYAKEYLNIDIAPLSERGCCFTLAQYNIKHASEAGKWTRGGREGSCPLCSIESRR